MAYSNMKKRIKRKLLDVADEMDILAMWCSNSEDIDLYHVEEHLNDSAEYLRFAGEEIGE